MIVVAIQAALLVLPAATAGAGFISADFRVVAADGLCIFVRILCAERR
jgi:hypothetical protein